MIANKDFVFTSAPVLALPDMVLEKEPALTVPGKVILKNGVNSGEILVTLPPARRVYHYIFQYISVPREGVPEKNDHLFSSRSGYTISGLIPGTKYRVRTGAFTIAGTFYSEYIDIVCQ